MSDKPETLAAILAEMRAAAKSTDLFNGEEVGEPLIRGTKVEEWADRIEAAAERKCATLEDALAHCKQYAQKIERENEEGETRLDAEEIIATVDNEFAGIRLARAPGNAAALRNALKAAQALLLNIDFDADGGLDDDAAPVMANIGHALAAPARNCDRFATVGAAHKAWRATDQERDFFDWLFDMVEKGGAK